MEATLETKAETILEFITDTWVPHAVRHNHSRGAEQDQVWWFSLKRRGDVFR